MQQQHDKRGGCLQLLGQLLLLGLGLSLSLRQLSLQGLCPLEEPLNTATLQA